MNRRSRRIITLSVLCLVLTLGKIPDGASQSRTNATPGVGDVQPPLTGILTTSGNRPITVNGIGTASGATILDGAALETPSDVTANVDIPGHAVIEIATNTALTVRLGQDGYVTVTILRGCLTLRTRKGTTGEVYDTRAVLGKTDPARDDVVETCHDKGAGAPVPGPGGLFGLGRAATIAIITSGIFAGTIAIVEFRSNPSPSAP